MKTAILLAVALLGACATSPDAVVAEEITASVPLWPVGTWSCSKDFSGYHGFDIWTTHNAAALYQVVSEPHGVFRGRYEELGVDAPINFEDTWRVSEIQNPDGTYNMNYKVTSTDGTSIEATGALHGQLVDAPIILGFVDLVGSITMPDGSVLPWRAGWSSDGPPDDIGVNFKIGIGGGSFQTYFGALCNRK